MAAPKTAVILAAGMGTRLGSEWRLRPKGFLSLGERPIVEESLERLRRAEIDRVLIVTGHCNEYYDEIARRSGGMVETVHNARYQHSGSMYSLYLLKEMIHDDFLLLESDLIYEQRALTSAIKFPQDNCVLLSGLTGSSDEVFVELAAGRLVRMSKDRSELGKISGELVGITTLQRFPENYSHKCSQPRRNSSRTAWRKITKRMASLPRHDVIRSMVTWSKTFSGPRSTMLRTWSGRKS
jgi:2-aminoethylphosphonate-pyruvate transaminase